MKTEQRVDRLRVLGAEVHAATEARDQEIHQARSEGMTLRSIAEAVGLSHTAVAKILARS